MHVYVHVSALHTYMYVYSRYSVRYVVIYGNEYNVFVLTASS